MKSILIYFISMSLLILSSGCSKKVYVPAETLRESTDTLRVNTLRHDSIHLRDSIVTIIQGDTLRIERYRDKYHTRIIRDTIMQTSHEFIEVPVIVEREKEISRLNRLQKFLIGLGEVTFLSLFLLLILWICRSKIPFKKGQ